MTSLSEYFEESLYPLQNGVLRAVENCKTRFYLTGGTALSRAYYRHRYSDEFEGIRWIVNPGWETFQKDIEKIAFDMMSVSG